MKKLIHPENYDESFKDRRMDMPRLSDDPKTWIPIIVPVFGVAISVGMYIALVSSTAVLAKDTQCKVDINDISSRERDKELTIGYNENKLKIAKHDEALKYIQDQMCSINNKLDRVLTKIEYR